MNDKYFVSYAYFDEEGRQIFGNAVFEVPKGQDTLEAIKAVEAELAAFKRSETIVLFFYKCSEPGKIFQFGGKG